MTLKELIADKVVSHVPMYSMFDHSTKMLNLNCDGNVNRWMTQYYKASSWKELNIYGPRKEITVNYNEMQKKLEFFQHFNFIETSAIKTNAGYQRSKGFADEFIDGLSEWQRNKLFSSDLIVCEGQQLLYKLLAIREDGNYSFKLMYMCGICNTNHKARPLFEKDKSINEDLFKKVDYVEIIGKDQIQYLKECNVPDDYVVFNDELIDRSLPFFSYVKQDDIVNEVKKFKKVIYTPFRLSDDGYQLWNIVDVAKDLDDEVVTFCPNVNNSSVEELVQLCKKHLSSLEASDVERFLKNAKSISTSRDVFYSVIDNCDNVVVPYFEDIDFVPHVGADEMMKCDKVVCKVCRTKEAFAEEMKEFKKHE